MTDSLFIRSQEKKNEIKQLNISNKTKVIYTIISLFLSALCVCGIVCLLFNLMVYYDLMLLITIGISICIFIFYFLFRVIYYKALAQDKCGSLKDIYLEQLIYALIIAFIAFYIL